MIFLFQISQLKIFKMLSETIRCISMFFLACSFFLLSVCSHRGTEQRVLGRELQKHRPTQSSLEMCSVARGTSTASEISLQLVFRCYVLHATGQNQNRVNLILPFHIPSICVFVIMFLFMLTLNTIITIYSKQQPMRSKHCQTCQHCVRRYDHHCPWIENCVGERNHRWFVLYLAVQLLVLLWGLHIAWWV